MRRTRFDDAYCPIARTTDLLGDWWTPLVLRELFWGTKRFDELTENLSISRAVLTERLKRLTTEGVIDRVQYQERPARYEYVLTDKGTALWDVMAAMWRFGEDWLFPDAEGNQRGAWVELFDKATGETIEPLVVDQRTKQPVPLTRTRIRRKDPVT